MAKVIRQFIKTSKIPAPRAPYSQAVRVNDMLYLAGIIGLNPETGQLAGEVVQEATQSLENIKAILEEAGITMDHVVKTTVLLADINDFAKVNEVYAKYFTAGKYPARAAYQVAALPFNGRIEIEVIAAFGEIEDQP